MENIVVNVYLAPAPIEHCTISSMPFTLFSLHSFILNTYRININSKDAMAKTRRIKIISYSADSFVCLICLFKCCELGRQDIYYAIQLE